MGDVSDQVRNVPNAPVCKHFINICSVYVDGPQQVSGASFPHFRRSSTSVSSLSILILYTSTLKNFSRFSFFECLIFFFCFDLDSQLFYMIDVIDNGTPVKARGFLRRYFLSTRQWVDTPTRTPGPGDSEVGTLVVDERSVNVRRGQKERRVHLCMRITSVPLTRVKSIMSQ